MERFKEYASKVPDTLAPYGGRVWIRAHSDSIYQGGNQFANIGILKFPDVSNATDWYKSDAYQALIPLRNAGAESNIVSYDVIEWKTAAC